MFLRKCFSSAQTGGSRVFIFIFLLLFCILCTSYEYIINVTVGSNQYSTFVGFDMIAQIRNTTYNTQTQKIWHPPQPGIIVPSNLDKNNEDKVKADTKKLKNASNLLSNSKDENGKNRTGNLTQVNAKNMTMESNRESQKDIRCPGIPTELHGRLKMEEQVSNISTIIKENPQVSLGGEFSPSNCTPRHNVAIIVPYRNRFGQLAVFLRHLHPFLRRQDLHYRIYIINQVDEHLFNRAMLMNVGFREAMEDYRWDCCIFHDVDLLPEDDRNLYTCSSQPRHMSVAVDKFKYKLPYKTIFGGVAAISVAQFRQLNGFSNQFWGWGGEDDDMAKRIQHHKMKVTRYKPEIARYTMVKHKQEMVNKDRGNILKTSHKR